jgi:hypothetical protein
MKAKNQIRNRYTVKRDGYLRQLGQMGPFVEGSLCQVRRPRCTKPAWQLTFKVRGRTRTVYVPVGLAQEVRQWADAHRRLKKLTRQVTAQSLAIIRGHTANQRAAARARRLMSPTS